MDSVQGNLPVHPHQHLLPFGFLRVATLTGVRCYPILILTYISLVIGYVQHCHIASLLFICFSFEKWTLLGPFLIFKLGFSCY
jgi:hypothetical protein